MNVRMLTGAILAASFLALSSPFAQAKARGGTDSGGGDGFEIKVNEIRADILAWINNKGATALTLPAHTNYEDYVSRMTDYLAPKKVVVSFVIEDDEFDEELQVKIAGVPKTCRSFVSKKDSRPHILCNIARFKSTADSEQYRLIHHEYAVLVGIERNDGAASDYFVSSQVTDYLTFVPVLKLAVKKPISTSPGTGHGFDAMGKLNEGRRYLISTQEKIRINQSRVSALGEHISSVYKQLTSIGTQNKTLRRLFEACAAKLSTEGRWATQTLTESAVVNFQEHTERTFSALEESVGRYIQSERCANCDPETRDEALLKYRNRILDLLEKLRPGTSDLVDVPYWEEQFDRNIRCDFTELFTFHDSESFTQNIMNRIGYEYENGLTPAEILSGQYLATLEFISRNAPVQVVRQGSLLGHPDSRFDGAKVHIKATYDSSILSGTENVAHPELRNPIKIIQRDR